MKKCFRPSGPWMRICGRGEKAMTGVIIALVFLLAADQLTKAAAFHLLRGSDGIRLIPGVLELTYVENRGAAFGILKEHQSLFILLSVVVCIGLLTAAFRMRKNRGTVLIRFLCAALCAGALGNAIDRIRHHFVIDFIYVSLIRFPVFNLADIYVTAGCFLLVLVLLMQDHTDSLM